MQQERLYGVEFNKSRPGVLYSSLGVNGANNNFGEISSTSVSGFVYEDDNNNGVIELLREGAGSGP